MIDWYMLLAPLVALPIVLLFGFVGCGLPGSGELEGLTVTLRWKTDLGPIVGGIEVIAKINSDTFTNKKDSQTTDDPKALHNATPLQPAELKIPFDKQPPEFVVCDTFCTLFDTGGKPITALPSGYNEGIVGGDGRRWVFELRPTPGQPTPFDIEFAGEETQ